LLSCQSAVWIVFVFATKAVRSGEPSEGFKLDIEAV
jgi:hypothetical protein